LYLNRPVEAVRVVESAMRLGADSEVHHWVLLQVGFLTGDVALVDREREWASRHPRATPRFLEAEAEEAAFRGRLRDALAHLKRLESFVQERSAPTFAAFLRLRMAQYEALFGRTADAKARLARELAADHDEMAVESIRVRALLVTVPARDLSQTSALIAELDRAHEPGAAQPDAGFVLIARAALETDRGRPDVALELLRPLARYELGCAWGLRPLFERARTHLAAGDHERARAAYESILTHPAVRFARRLLPLAQLGLARALAAGGHVARSREAYDELLGILRNADADLPLLADARRERSALE
jgi:tetratricopeptide (TPR) repeat protein